jgi:hypothetical protein
MAWTEDEQARHDQLAADLERLNDRAEAFVECFRLMREYVIRNPPRTEGDSDLVRLMAMTAGGSLGQQS